MEDRVTVELDWSGGTRVLKVTSSGMSGTLATKEACAAIDAYRKWYAELCVPNTSQEDGNGND